MHSSVSTPFRRPLCKVRRFRVNPGTRFGVSGETRYCSARSRSRTDRRQRTCRGVCRKPTSRPSGWSGCRWTRRWFRRTTLEKMAPTWTVDQCTRESFGPLFVWWNVGSSFRDGLILYHTTRTPGTDAQSFQICNLVKFLVNRIGYKYCHV